MIGQTEVPAPPDNLLELGPVGVIVFGVLFLAAMVITYLIASKRASAKLVLLPLLLAPLLLSGCALFAPKYDPISEQHAREALDTIEHDLNPALTDTQKKIAIDQAREWVKYETSKGE